MINVLYTKRKSDDSISTPIMHGDGVSAKEGHLKFHGLRVHGVQAIDLLGLGEAPKRISAISKRVAAWCFCSLQ